MGLGKLKVWGWGILVFLVGLLGFLWRSEQLARSKESLQRVKRAREAEHRADKTINKGLKREREKVSEAIKRARTGGRRDHFE